MNNHSLLDTNFLSTFRDVRMLVDSGFKNNEELNSFKNITYKSIFDYEKQYTNLYSIYKESNEEIGKWNKRYSNYLSMFARDSAKYSNYIKENNYENFVELILVKIRKKPTWLIDEPTAYIKAVPKNGVGIRKIQGYIKINPLPDDNIQASFGTLFSFQGYSKNEFNIEAVEYSSYNSNELDEYIDIPTNIIEQKNRISFDVDELIIDDRYVDTKLEKVPSNMVDFLKKKNMVTKDYIISENYGKDYKSLNLYLGDNVREKLSNDFKKEQAFFEEGYKGYYNLKYKD